MATRLKFLRRQDMPRGRCGSAEERREAVFPFAISLGRNVGHRAAIPDLSPNGVRIVALVGVQNVAIGQLFEKGRARRAIGDLAAGEHERDRSAQCVGQRVDFRRAASARAADRLIFLPPFPPAAER